MQPTSTDEYWNSGWEDWEWTRACFPHPATCHAVGVQVDEEATFQFGTQIEPAVLHIWSENFNDPMIGSAAMDVITALAENSRCLPGLCQTILPVVSEVMTAPSERPNGAVEASLDLLTVLVGTRVPQVACGVHSAMRQPVMQLLAESDDASILQSCTKLLQAIVSQQHKCFPHRCVSLI